MRRVERWICWGLFVAVVGMTWSCGTTRKSGLCEEVGVPKAQPGDLAAIEKAAQDAWEKRADEAQLKAAIDQLRKAVATAPSKTSNYVKLAKALYFWGDGFLRFDEKNEEMIQAFEQATYYAEQALRLQNEEFQLSVCAGDSYKKTVKTIRKEDIPAVYWYAVALGKYGLAKSIVIVLDNKDKIAAMMRMIRRVDPNYHHGAADRYLGAFHTKIPFPKGDLPRSKKYFETSIKRAPNYLATRVLMAQMLAPKLKDRALFKAQLDYVMAASLDVIPGMEPEHAIEKRKAEALLDDIDILFPKE